MIAYIFVCIKRNWFKFKWKVTSFICDYQTHTHKHTSRLGKKKPQEKYNEENKFCLTFFFRLIFSCMFLNVSLFFFFFWFSRILYSYFVFLNLFLWIFVYQTILEILNRNKTLTVALFWFNFLCLIFFGIPEKKNEQLLKVNFVK